MRARVVTKRWWVLVMAAALLSGCTSTTSSFQPPSTETAAAISTTQSTSSGSATTSNGPGRPATTGPTARQQISTPSLPPVTAAPGSALSALHALAVKGRAPKTGYSRAQFGQAWTDDVTADGGHNGCDTRNDILRRDLGAVVVKARTQGCVAASGTLHDPYTGREIAFVRGAKTSVLVQIDHVVALSDAWQTGAQNLGADDRQNLANDPLELLAVDGPTNESKGDGDAATWLPPDKPYRCDYVARQIAVKSRYRLWVTAAERAAMDQVLATCPTQELPTAAMTDVPAVNRT